MKINFFGTDIFASIVLKMLVESNFSIGCVITKPDDFVGRKKILTESKVALLAHEFNIPVLKPSKLTGFISELSQFSGDINIVCEYGKIIPDDVLYLPKFKSVNIHGSILPMYRGASPIQFAIMNGDLKTGVTLMEMDDKMDHGNIISIAECDIEKTDTEPILREKLANIGSRLLIEELNYLIKNNHFSNSIKQDESLVTYTRMLKKEDGFIDLTKENAQNIINKFRAFIKWPGIFVTYNDKRLKLTDIDFDTYLLEELEEGYSRDIFIVSKKQLYLVCADKKLIKINKLQFETKNEITSVDFINQLG